MITCALILRHPTAAPFSVRVTSVVHMHLNAAIGAVLRRNLQTHYRRAGSLIGLHVVRSCGLWSAMWPFRRFCLRNPDSVSVCALVRLHGPHSSTRFEM